MWVTVKDEYGSRHMFKCTRVTMYNTGTEPSSEWKILLWTYGNTDKPEHIISCQDAGDAELKYSMLSAELAGGPSLELETDDSLYFEV